MKAYYCKLIPPRPSFAEDMSDREAGAMEEHAAYWDRGMAQGTVVIFGPVADPAGIFGMGVIEVLDEHEGRSFLDNDPAIRSGVLRYELHLMPQGAIRPATEVTPSRAGT